MLGTLLMILLFLLVITLCVIICQMYMEHMENRHQDEMENVKEQTEEEMRQWTLWIYDPERRYSERHKEMMEYRAHLIQEWKRDGKSFEQYQKDLEVLDGYINHYLDRYHEQLFAATESED